MDDVDRIEVISGPGATLWGANAMNGVINIITRRAGETQGTYCCERRGHGGATRSSARYGQAFDGGAFRVYAKWFDRGATEIDDGTSAGDDWHKVQSGFRRDFGSGANAFTVQGDCAAHDAQHGCRTGSRLHGATCSADGSTRASARKRACRCTSIDSRIASGRRAASRSTSTPTTSSSSRARASAPGTASSGASAAATTTTTPSTTRSRSCRRSPHARAHQRLRAGHDPPQRTVQAHRRASSSRTTATRAGRRCRTCACRGRRTTRRCVARGGRAPSARRRRSTSTCRNSWAATLFLFGNPDFKPEKVTAYELGIPRPAARASISWSISAFYNEYDDLRSIEVTPVTLLSARLGQSHRRQRVWLRSLGELADRRPWWRLSPGFRSLHKRLSSARARRRHRRPRPGGNDPRSQASLKSIDDLRRFIGRCAAAQCRSAAGTATDDYTELRRAFRVAASTTARSSLSRASIYLTKRHLEYAPPARTRDRRAASWRRCASVSDFRFSER